MGGRTAAVVGRITRAAEHREASDRELLRRFAADGDQAAFAALVRRHAGLVLGVCKRALAHDQDAEDACQAAFVVLARKAATGRWQPSVANWLYATARRVCRNARVAADRRAKREGRAAVPEAVTDLDRMSGREAFATLDEELDRLPPRYREPLVLCYLQGLTRDEAAARLGVSPATLKSQLDRGRARLAAALGRRGIAVGAGLLAGAAATRPGTAGVVNAVLAAVRGRPPKIVADLARAAGPNEVGTRVTVLATMAAGVALLGVAAMSPPGGPPSGKATPAKTAPAGERKPARDDKAVAVAGTVVGPDGRPVEGATVSAWPRTAKTDAPLVRTKTDRAGRFRLAVPKAEGQLVATADGFGPDWHELTAAGKDVTLRLAPDDVPIRGRFLNLEGRGIAGVSVRVRRIEKRADGGDLEAVVATKRKWAHRQYVNGPDLTALPAAALPGPAVTTDAEGRFRLSGIGRERVVSLTIEGKAIEPINVEVFTRAGPVTGLFSGNENDAVYGAAFERVIPPGKPVVGTVREKGTGQPLAGIRVSCGRCSARTDADGRYRIDGPRKRDQYRVEAHGVPFFDVTKSSVPDTPGFEPVTVDFELERGIEVRGRVLDRATGKPVAGTITYLAFRDNPHLKRFSGPRPGGSVREDGSFSFTALPGPGVLAVIADEDNYLKVKPAADWKLIPEINWIPGVAHAFVRIDVSEKDGRSAPLEIRLEPAATVHVEVVGPDNKRAPAYYAAGLTASARQNVSWVTQKDSPTIAVRGLGKDERRTVVVLTADGKHGAAREVRADEAVPIRMRLEPLSGLTGRVVGADGRPRAGLRVRAFLEHPGTDGTRLTVQFLMTQGTWAAKLEPTAKTDADGQFRLDGLMPGLTYSLVASDDGELARREGVTPPPAGKTEDVGQLRTR